jgi:hypothetical protein
LRPGDSPRPRGRCVTSIAYLTAINGWQRRPRAGLLLRFGGFSPYEETRFKVPGVVMPPVLLASMVPILGLGVSAIP